MRRVVLILPLIICFSTALYAHCDTLSGPVVVTARAALATGEITPLLKWVRPTDEAELRQAFAQALAVRKLGDDARNLADSYFFDTAVRLHRSSEGEPVTGVHPDTDAEPSILEADSALAKASVNDLETSIADDVKRELRARFRDVVEKKKHADESVEQGRAYVAAYVHYVHFVEALDKVMHEAHE